MLDCHFCGDVRKNLKSLAQHQIRCSRNPDRIPWVVVKAKGTPAWNKGLRKETDVRVRKNSESLSKSLTGRNLHKIDGPTRRKISVAMELAHAEGRAWNIGKSRWNNKASYPESFFVQVIGNEFSDRNYVREFPVGIYSADFCWPDKMKVIEIDGEQHTRFLDVIERDRRKDAYLALLGYSVLRIPWKDMFNEPRIWIDRAILYIHG